MDKKAPKSYEELEHYFKANDFAKAELNLAIEFLEQCSCERLDGYRQASEFLKRFLDEQETSCKLEERP